MHNEVHSPPTSRKLTDVLTELENWETQLREYYECGGDVIPDETKLVIAMGKLPANTPSSLRRALRGIVDYRVFKHDFCGGIKYLEDFGGLPSGSAHVLGHELS